MMDIEQGQRDMRGAYAGGAPGVAVSGLVWLAAGLVVLTKGLQAGILTLFFGGMAIHPVGVVLSRWLGASGGHRRDNPLRHLAIESTVLLLVGVALSFALSQRQAELFFPVMLVVIGGRYLTFQTLYGLRLFWLCGVALAALGLVSLVKPLAPSTVALGGGAVELAFSAALFVLYRRGVAKAA